MTVSLLYCHGFQSSPQSAKALATKAFFARHYPAVELYIPQLPCYPEPTRTLLENFHQQARYPVVGYIGSSLGGYLATYLANRYGGKAVLINPAVQPYKLLQDINAELVQPYTGERFRLNADHIAQLRQMDVSTIAEPGNIWALIQKGDEVLDYRQAAEKYRHCRVSIEPGGEHSFPGYERYLADIAGFLLGEH